MSNFIPSNFQDNNDESLFVIYNQKLLLEYSKLIRKEVIVKTIYEYKNEVDKNCCIKIGNVRTKYYNTDDLRMKIIMIENQIRKSSISFLYNCDIPTLKLNGIKDKDWTEFIKRFNKNYVDIHKKRMNEFRRLINQLQFDYNIRVDGDWIIKPTPVRLNEDIRWINTDLRVNNNYELIFDRFTKKQVRSIRLIDGVKVFNHNQYLLLPVITLRDEYDNFDGEILYQVQRGIKDLIDDTKNSIKTIYEKYSTTEYLTETINIEECCVCYDNTSLITNCNHYLCKDCYSGLVRPKLCPLCRRRLNDTKIQPQEQKEEPPQEQKEEPPSIIEEQLIQQLEQLNINETEEGKVVEDNDDEETEEIIENPKYYNIEEQELFNNYILNEMELSVNGSIFKVYYFKIEMTDNEITRLFPNIMRNPKIEMNCNVRLGYIEISVEIN